MKRIIALIIALLGITVVCSGQKLIKTYQYYYSGDTAKARKVFAKFIKKKREPYAAQYGLALCQMPWNKHDAFLNFKKLDTKFRTSGKDFAKYMKNNYGITRDSVKYRMDEIASSDLRSTILSDSTERGFKKYIKAHNGCSPQFLQQAAQLQEACAYREALKDTTLTRAQAFLINYPNSRKYGYMSDFVDSVIYFRHLMYGTLSKLKRFIYTYPKNKYAKYAQKLIDANFDDEEYYFPGVTFTFTPEYFERWKHEAYYSGHWTRLRFLYERAPYLMDDTLKRMYYASLYGEYSFQTRKMIDRKFNWHTDSIYNFYILRGAPSLLAFRKMQEMYAYHLYRGQYDCVEAVLRRYEPLFPNFKHQFSLIRRVMYEEYYRCRKQRLPDIINQKLTYISKQEYLDSKGKRILIKESKTPKHVFPAYPVIAPDGQSLYFSLDTYQTIELKTRLTCENQWDSTIILTAPLYLGTNIYRSQLKGGKWTQPQPIDGINGIKTPHRGSKVYMDKLKCKTDTAEVTYICKVIKDTVSLSGNTRPVFVSGISNDHSKMLIIREDRLRHPGNRVPAIFDDGLSVSVSVNRGGVWSHPGLIPEINHLWQTDSEGHHLAHVGNFNAHYSPDGNIIVFASARPDVPAYNENFRMADPNGYISYLTRDTYYSDIYISFRSSNGKWSYPRPISRDINTEYNELSPVIAADNKTLYFVSDAHYGMGGTDIFMTQRTDSTWKHWTAPVNLGKYINTPFDEYDFSITADGRTAVFSSQDPKSGELEIYKVELPPALRPDTVAIYSGKIANLEGEPVEARITVFDISRNRPFAQFNSLADGSFYFGLPQDSAYYQLSVSAPGYVAQKDYLNAQWGRPITRKHDFTIFSENDIFNLRLSIPFQEISFADDGYALDDHALDEISRTARLFQGHQCDTIQITATAPNTYTARQRVEAVAQALKRCGTKEVITEIKTGKPKIEYRRP